MGLFLFLEEKFIKKESQIMTGVVDTKMPQITVENVENNLGTFYKVINCNYIDGHEYDFIVDYECLLKQRYVSVISGFENLPIFVGNVIVCNHTQNRHFSSLDESDIERIKFRIQPVINSRTLKLSKVLIVNDKY